MLRQFLTTDKFVQTVQDKFSANRQLLLVCVLSTFVWGLLAHAYMAFNSSFSHDSISELIALNDWKLVLGRVFAPIYFWIRGQLALPWLVVFLSLVFISLSVCLISKIFEITSKSIIFLISGTLTVNATVSALISTYLHDVDSYMLSVLLAIVSVYLWKRFEKGYLYGAIPLCLSIGLYQAYISITISLIVFYFLMELLEGKRFSSLFRKGMESMFMVVFGGAVLFSLKSNLPDHKGTD